MVEQHEEFVKTDRIVGTTFADQYEILGLLGAGGMGAVYKARQVSLDRTVAVKVMHHSSVLPASSLSRFQREAAVLERLSHPNIVNFFQFGVTPEGIPYVVLEYLDGKDLGAHLKVSKSLDFEDCWKLFDQILDAMAAAHADGVVHRDLKPGNIIVIGAPDTVRDGKVKILDFGLARLLDDGSEGQKVTKPGALLGTPLYMSPEQATGKAATAQSDIYAIGCIFYECLTGRAPFVGESFYTVMMQHIAEEPPSMLKSDGTPLDPSVEKLVLKAICKDPADRYASAAEFQQALRTLAATGKITANSIGRRSPRTARGWPKVPSLLWMALSVIAVIVSGLLFLQPRLGRRYDLEAEGQRAVSLCHDQGNYREMKSVLERALNHATDSSQKAQLEPFLAACANDFCDRLNDNPSFSEKIGEPPSFISCGQWVLGKFIELPPSSRQNKILAVKGCYTLMMLTRGEARNFRGEALGGDDNRAESYVVQALNLCAIDEFYGATFGPLMTTAKDLAQERLIAAMQATDPAVRARLLDRAEVIAKAMVGTFSHETGGTISLRPYQGKAYQILGAISEARKNYSDAINNYKKAVPFSAAGDTHHPMRREVRSAVNQQIVLCEIARGNPAAALLYTTKLLDEQNAPPEVRGSDPVESLYLHGWALMANGRVPEAEEYFLRGRQVCVPVEGRLQRISGYEVVIGNVAREQGRFADAELHCRAGIEGLRTLDSRKKSAQGARDLKIAEDLLVKIQAHRRD